MPNRMILFFRIKKTKMGISSILVLLLTSSMKYIGCHIAGNLSDDKDIESEPLALQANLLVCKFSMCSVVVKVARLGAFSIIYTACLWHCF